MHATCAHCKEMRYFNYTYTCFGVICTPNDGCELHTMNGVLTLFEYASTLYEV